MRTASSMTWGVTGFDSNMATTFGWAASWVARRASRICSQTNHAAAMATTAVAHVPSASTAFQFTGQV